MKYHIWDPDTDDFDSVQELFYHQIETNLGAAHAAERWVDEHYDPDNEFPSLNNDGVLVVVRDETGMETRARVTGSRSITYTAVEETSE